MKKITLPLLVLLLAVNSCKKDPKPGPEEQVPTNKEYEWVDATVSLPDGVNYSLAGHELNAVGEALAISGNGATKVPKMTNSVAIYAVTNASGEPIMFGYSTPGKTEISPEATAKVTLFTLYRLAALPIEVQVKFLEGFDSDQSAAPYVETFVERWKTDPKTLVSKSYVPLLKAYHMTYNAGKDRDVSATMKTMATEGRYHYVETEEGKLEDGYSLELEDNSKFYITNEGPRTATAFIYKTKTKKNNSLNTQTLIDKFSGSTEASRQWFIENGTYVPDRNFLGLEVNYRQFIWNGRIFFNKVTSGPHDLPLEDDEELAEYTIRIVNAGAKIQDDELTDAEWAAYVKHMHAALVIDFYLPFMGISLGLDIDDFYALSAEERVDRLDAAFREAGVHTLIEGYLRGGRLQEMLKTLETYFQSESTSYGVKLHEAIFKALGVAVPSNLAGAAKRYGYLSYYFDGASFWNTEQEERLFMNYYWETYGLISLNATARAGVVRVSPRRANISTAGTNNKVQLEAKIESEEFNGISGLTYRWRTPSTYGSLISADGSRGNELKGTAANIEYQADFALGRGKSVTEKVYVDVLKDDQLVGTDSAEVTIAESRYRIYPNGITLTGNGDRGATTVNLRVEPLNDDAPKIQENPDHDFKVVWRTAGKHGGLRWNGQYASYWVTETEGLNSNVVQYRCSDDQTKEGVEDVEALIFMKPKGALEADYELVDIVKASIKIDNDEKKKIVYIPLVEVLTDTIQGIGKDAYRTCMGRGVANVPIEKDAIKYSARAMGTGISWVDGKVWNWDAGTNPGWFTGYGHPRGISGNNYTIAVSVLEQRNGPADNSVCHTDYLPVSGMVEVTIWLK
ncbi:hypothetical protein GCM10011386_29070 [Parapedobacter defluvii]|uniref:Uncharacterized protein n=1 Tax=Parapedobacter defluvii TaxID=2045106 RepID=A0ABQ1M579_9SPHI|nr:hypothetical protein [Parapedobacter defluvii]GGC35128.1 hypothetical protein GCM10011386_29070 [Parapedobacter defluvii]